MGTPVDNDPVFQAAAELRAAMDEMDTVRKLSLGYRASQADFRGLADQQDAVLPALLATVRQKSQALVNALSAPPGPPS